MHKPRLLVVSVALAPLAAAFLRAEDAGGRAVAQAAIVDAAPVVAANGGGRATSTQGLPSGATTAGDLDGDGKADLVWRQTETGDLAEWLMDGATVKQAPVVAANLPLTWQIAGVCDLDDDGKDDLVWRNAQTGDVSAWFMDGLRVTHASVIAQAVSPLAWRIVGVGDVDGDHKCDLVWRQTQTGDVGVWLMDGAHVKASPVLASVPLSWQVAGVGDVDGDLKADLVWRDMQNGDVAVWLMDGGVVTAAPIVASGVPLAWQIAGVGDLDGDGKSDLVWRHGETGDVAAWLMNGAAVSRSAIVSPGVPLTYQILTLRDMDGDGRADLIWTWRETYQIWAYWLMNGVTVQSVSATMVVFQGLITNLVPWTLVGVGDFDGDGKGDLVGRDTQTGAVGAMFVFPHVGALLSATPALTEQVIQVADLNGDGKADLVWSEAFTGGYQLTLWLMKGATTNAVANIAYLPPGWQRAGAGDLDGDGKADLVWRNVNTGDVAVWLMDGARIKRLKDVASGVPLTWQIAGVGDLDGDGKADLVWRNTQTGDVAVWLMDGVDVKLLAFDVSPSVAHVWQIAGVGDLDGDGKADLVWRNALSGAVAAWFMNGATVLGSAIVAPQVPLTWQIVKLGDFDGDGKVDLAWRHTERGDVAVWLMDGTTVKQSSPVSAAMPLVWQIQ